MILFVFKWGEECAMDYEPVCIAPCLENIQTSLSVSLSQASLSHCLRVRLFQACLCLSQSVSLRPLCLTVSESVFFRPVSVCLSQASLSHCLRIRLFQTSLSVCLSQSSLSHCLRVRLFQACLCLSQSVSLRPLSVSEFVSLCGYNVCTLFPLCVSLHSTWLSDSQTVTE